MRHMTRVAAALGLGAVAAGWGAAADAAPSYAFLTDIAVPVASPNSSGGVFNAFDISAFDASTQLAYIADRSNDAIDVFSSATDSFVTRISGFAGARVTNSISGPDGVAIVNGGGQHVLWAGDGNSTARAFTIGGGPAPTFAPLATINTGGAFRVDEMAFDATDHRLLVANNADSPPFATLIDTVSSTAAKTVTFNGAAGQPNASGGIEASAYSPKDGAFYLNLVQLQGGSLAGAVAKIDPISGATLKVYDLSAFGISDCSPAGVSLTSGNQLFIGCGDRTQNILFDPNANGGNGAVVKTFAEANGADEVWCDPASGLCFAAGRTGATGLGELDIIDPASLTLLQSIPTQGGAHSVSVDPVTGQVFLPEGTLGNTDPACVAGCIKVFAPAAAVPEPATLPLVAAGMLGLMALARRRRRGCPGGCVRM